MTEAPTVRFLSLFVPELTEARQRYAAMLGVEPMEGDEVCPRPHPFAAAGPVVFDLGSLRLALYQCDMRGTHPGDVGIGLCGPEGPEALAARARGAGARLLRAATPAGGDGRSMAVFMMPDRHFFEAMGARDGEAR
jgi:hypothetical protein